MAIETEKQKDQETDTPCHYVFDIKRPFGERGVECAFWLCAESLKNVPLGAEKVRPVKEGEILGVYYDGSKKWPFRQYHDHSIKPIGNEVFGYDWVQLRFEAFEKEEGEAWKKANPER